MNRISKLLFALFLLQSSITKAQLGLQDRLRTGVSYDLNLFAQSNQFDKDLFFKSFWDEDLKNRQLERTPGQTKLGWGTGHTAAYQWGALGENAFKKIYYVRLSYHDLHSIDLDTDLTKVALLGNSHTRGQTIDVNSSGTDAIEYSSLGFGFERISDQNKQIRYQLGANIFAGHSLNAQNTSSGTITTDSMLEHVTLDLDYISQSKMRSLSSGMGLGIDLGISKHTGDRYFKISIRDLGFINWSKTTELENASRPQRFEGVFVPDIQISEFNWLDSVNKELVLEETRSVLRLTPFNVTLDAEFRLSTQSALGFNARYFHLIGFIPEISAQYLKIWKSNRVSFGLKYGGFGVLRSHCSLLLQRHNILNFKLDLESPESLIMNDLPMGLAVRTGVIWNL